MTMMVDTLIALAAAAANEAPHHEATLLGLGPEGWVYAGVTIFFLLAIFVAKAHKQILAALDAQIAETRRTLDEAKAVRGEAEAMLAEAKRQQADATKQADAIVDHARHEAEAIISKAEADTSALVARRAKMAEEKIAAAERAAVESLRSQTAEAATKAARSLIAAQHGAKADKALVDEAIAGL